MGVIKSNFFEGLNMRALNRITLQQNVMGGKACVRGLRVTLRRLARRRARAGPDACMKLLLDMNLSPLLAVEMTSNGFETVHWSTVGALLIVDTQRSRIRVLSLTP